MGSFSNKNAGNGAYNNAQQAVKPKSLYSPFGNIQVAKNSVGYNPNISSDQQGILDNSNSKLLGVINNLPTSLTADDYYNNPFFASTQALYRNPILQQKSADDKELQAQLSAANQLGSSYDAYQKNLQNQRYDNLLSQADNQARAASASAYQQQFNNQQSLLQSLANAGTQTQQNILTPLQALTGYQNSLTPLQTASGSIYGSQAQSYQNAPTLFNQLLAGVNTFSNAGGQNGLTGLLKGLGL